MSPGHVRRAVGPCLSGLGSAHRSSIPEDAGRETVCIPTFLEMRELKMASQESPTSLQGDAAQMNPTVRSTKLEHSPRVIITRNSMTVVHGSMERLLALLPDVTGRRTWVRNILLYQ